MIEYQVKYYKTFSAALAARTRYMKNLKVTEVSYPGELLYRGKKSSPTSKLLYKLEIHKRVDK